MVVNPDNLLGKVLKQTYKLIEVIGQGGMSVVYRAQKFNSQQPVAVKILLPKYRVNSDAYNRFLRRFRREVEIISRFRHPNVMPILDYGEQDGLVYLVMPYIAGGTLDRLLQNGPLPPYVTLTYIEQVASALDYAHAQQVVHRDIKPGNFLLDTNGQLVLSDFGVAHVIGETFTQEGEFVGTRIYAPREAFFNGHIDRRADIYSLGVVLCEMLTGFTPTEAPDTFPTIPSNLDVIIRKATAESPQDRYASAGALAAALRIAIESEHNAPTLVSLKYDIEPGQGSIPVTTPASPGGRKRRLTLIVVSILFLIALASAGAFTGLYFANMTQQNVLQTPTPPPGQQAQNVVLQYYDFWNQGNYSAAYNLLSRDYQAKHSYSELSYSYMHTHRSCPNIDSTTVYSNSSVLITITDMAREDNPTKPGMVVNVYKGDFTAMLQEGSWRLTPSLHRAVAQGVC